MRILLVSHGYPPYAVTGVERVTEQTAHALAERGHEVTVLARRPTAAPPLPRAEKVRSAGGVDVVIVSGGAVPRHGAFPAFHERMEEIFERLVLQFLPDVVVIAHLASHSPGYVAVAHRWRVPVVMELHDFYTVCERAHLQRVGGERCTGPEGGAACASHCFAGEAAALERWTVRTLAFAGALTDADALIAPSRFVADYFRDRGQLTAPLHVLANGVVFGEPRDVRAPGSQGPLRLASLGPVTEHKGAHVVLRALRLAGLGDVRYMLFGEADPEYARRLHAEAEGVRGLDLAIHGRYQPRELPALLRSVDLVVIASVVWETFSIVAREAMACGVPVVAPRLGALPEAIRESSNGVLYEPDSPAELGAILQRLDSDRGLLRRLSDGIDRSDWITVAQRTQGLEAILAQTVRARARTQGAEERERARSLRALVG